MYPRHVPDLSASRGVPISGLHLPQDLWYSGVGGPDSV